MENVLERATAAVQRVILTALDICGTALVCLVCLSSISTRRCGSLLLPSLLQHMHCMHSCAFTFTCTHAPLHQSKSPVPCGAAACQCMQLSLGRVTCFLSSCWFAAAWCGVSPAILPNPSWTAACAIYASQHPRVSQVEKHVSPDHQLRQQGSCTVHHASVGTAP